MAMEIMAKVRRFAIGKAGLSPIVIRATGTESLAVAQVESDGTDMTRAGRRFMLGRSASVTGIAPFTTTLPTTTTQWAIWNADATKSYIFDHLGAVLVSGTSAASITVWAAIYQSPAATGANVAGITVANMSNGGPSSKAIVKSSAVSMTTPANGQWILVAQGDTTNTSVLAVAATNYDLRGQIIVPPGQGLGISVCSGTGTTPLFAPMACWSEVELDLE